MWDSKMALKVKDPHCTWVLFPKPIMEGGWSTQKVVGQPELHNKTLSQNTNKQINTEDWGIYLVIEHLPSRYYRFKIQYY